MRRLYLISFVTLSAIAAACGGKGDDSGGGGGDGDTTGDGDGDTTGDGDGDTTGDGDGDTTGDGDGDTTGDGDGDTTGDGDGDTSVGGVGGMGGSTGTGGDPGTGGDVGTGGEVSTEEGCSGTALSCEEQTEVDCIAAGCSLTPGCSGEAGCEALDNAGDCNSQLDELDCSFGAVCTGTPDECTEHEDSLTCETLGCTWVEN